MQMPELTSIQTSLNQFIVKPINAFGLGGFVFDSEGTSTVNLYSEITDHYTEANIAIQDHIAIAPQKITLKGYVGEVVYRTDQTNNTSLQKAVRKLTTLTNYLPVLTTGVKQAMSVLKGETTLDNIKPSDVNKVVDLWALTKNLNPGASKQQQAYLYFKALFEQKILVSVQTPFEFMTNMAIESITAIQTEDTKYITDFAITLKKIRVAETKQIEGQKQGTTAPSGAPKRQGRSNVQIQAPKNTGKTAGRAIPDLSTTVKQKQQSVLSPPTSADIWNVNHKSPPRARGGSEYGNPSQINLQPPRAR